MGFKPKKDQLYKNWKLIKNLDNGKGGNGLVWKVTNGDQVAAIKFLQSRHFGNSKRVARFKDEIQTMNDCSDIEGVLPLIDFDIPDTIDFANPIWFVSELAVPLEKILNEETNLEKIVDACHSFSVTLEKLHQRGISHRDIKPDNLFSLEGKWVIGDFGLVEYPEKTDITGENERLGPLFYMAPEMLLNPSTSNGNSADVWSLAKTLWKLGTNQRYPIEGTLRQDIPSLKLSTYSQHPKAYLLDPILESATNIEPDKRITMSKFRDELKSWIESLDEKSKNVSNQNIDFISIKNKLSNMWLSARKENEERTIRENEIKKIKTIVDNEVVSFRNNIVNRLDKLVIETGLEHNISNAKSTFGSYISTINLPDFPNKNQANYLDGAFSIIYPPVISEDYLAGFLYGIGLALDLANNATIITGYWGHYFSRKRQKNYVNPYWVQTSKVVMNGANYNDRIEKYKTILINHFPEAFQKFLEEIKDYNLPRRIH